MCGQKSEAEAAVWAGGKLYSEEDSERELQNQVSTLERTLGLFLEITEENGLVNEA